jgi:hypothetical protein
MRGDSAGLCPRQSAERQLRSQTFDAVAGSTQPSTEGATLQQSWALVQHSLPQQNIPAPQAEREQGGGVEQ